MSTNTIVKAHKEALNDAAKDLMDPSVFLGVKVYGYSFQGSNFGYTSGGTSLHPGGTPTYNVNHSSIDKFSFASDTNASNVAVLTAAGGGLAGQSSSTHGYTSRIDKFTFATDGNAIDIGDLSISRGNPAGQSSSENGYSSGGFTPGIFYNVIDKFPFSAEGSASDVGDLTAARYDAGGQNSTADGYTSGGTSPGPNNTTTRSNVIDKFPFASDTSASDVGDLSVTRGGVAGQSSTVSVYTTGVFFPPGSQYNIIDKFPFASDANASDVGDLTVSHWAVGRPSGQSSTENGYTSGGNFRSPPSGPTGTHNVIDKFPFASDANASDVGNLSVTRSSPAGHQY